MDYKLIHLQTLTGTDLIFQAVNRDELDKEAKFIGLNRSEYIRFLIALAREQNTLNDRKDIVEELKK